MQTASWNQLERTIELLHAAAREPISVRDFYRQLAAEGAAALDAAGGAAWLVDAEGRPELIVQSLPGEALDSIAARRALVEKAIHSDGPLIAPSRASDGAACTPAHEYDCVLCPVTRPAPATAGASPAAVLALWAPAGASPPVRQGWLDFAAALADVAADFHARHELRQLRASSAFNCQAVELLRRATAARSLKGVAFEVANEGRRILACDRISVLGRRGKGWRVLAASGADHVPRRTDFTHHCCEVADQVARWGEPVELSDASAASDELPAEVAGAMEQFVDRSHARTLACVPITLNVQPSGAMEEQAGHALRRRPDLVLIAEQFAAGPSLRRQVVELGELCSAALTRAAQLDRFPVTTAIRWSERLEALQLPKARRRLAAWAAALACGLAALFLPVNFSIEAPARLAAVIERDIFATADGVVGEVHVNHGQLVREGDVLLVLLDPELALHIQEIRGQRDAVRQRLDSLAVSRTDRSYREDAADLRLPLSAEQLELEERLSGLQRQLGVLESRRKSLTLRSPCRGQVLTRDVQRLLESRPVERGQALLSVADLSSGWELRAATPQRQIRHVLAAQAARREPLAASFRLAGDVTQVHRGRVVEISASAPLDAEGLRDDAPPVDVRIAVDAPAPATARSGMSAAVRIHCGRHSLGYVWFHDVAATIYRWLTF